MAGATHDDRPPKDVVAYLGRTFGKLKVVGFEPNDGIWLCVCRCTCGMQVRETPLRLRNATQPSCGCIAFGPRGREPVVPPPRPEPAWNCVPADMAVRPAPLKPKAKHRTYEGVPDEPVKPKAKPTMHVVSATATVVEPEPVEDAPDTMPSDRVPVPEVAARPVCPPLVWTDEDEARKVARSFPSAWAGDVNAVTKTHLVEGRQSHAVETTCPCCRAHLVVRVAS